MANVAFQYFSSKGSGHLVGISSIGAIRGGAAPAYNASKQPKSTLLLAENKNMLTSQSAGGLLLFYLKYCLIGFIISCRSESARQTLAAWYSLMLKQAIDYLVN